MSKESSVAKYKKKYKDKLTGWPFIFQHMRQDTRVAAQDLHLIKYAASTCSYINIMVNQILISMDQSVAVDNSLNMIVKESGHGVDELKDEGKFITNI